MRIRYSTTAMASALLLCLIVSPLSNIVSGILVNEEESDHSNNDFLNAFEDETQSIQDLPGIDENRDISNSINQIKYPEGTPNSLFQDYLNDMKAFDTELIGPESYINDGLLYDSSYQDRTIVVHENDSSYFDELLYTAAVPAAIHWEGGSRHDSLLLYDSDERDTGNLHGDWAGYLESRGGLKHLDFLGGVNGTRRAEISSYYGSPEDMEVVTVSGDIYNASAEIAKYYWKEERFIRPDTAVIAYSPDPQGGKQVFQIRTNTSNTKGNYDVEVNASQVAWLETELHWEDQNDNSVYDIEMTDPYATHHAKYNTSSSWYKENPSNNVLNFHEGSRETGLSPLYSFMPIDPFGPSSNASFSDSVGPNDGSGVPEPPFADVTTHTIGPVKKGMIVECSLSWSDSSELELYVHPNGTTPAEYEFEYWWGQPVVLKFISTINGFWDISVHTYTGNGDSYGLEVHWSLPSELEWPIYQCENSDDSYTINTKKTMVLGDDIAESAANGAVLASLLDSPLLFTAGVQPEQAVMNVLEDLGIDNLIIVDPFGRIDSSAWENRGLAVEHLDSDYSVFNMISDIGYRKTWERDVVVPALGGPWFTSAALEGAAHAAPVPFPNDPLALSATNLSTRVWWNMLEWADTLGAYTGSSASSEDHPPKRSSMESIADYFYDWLGNFNPAYNPSCNDNDSDGIPDSGLMWNYSKDIDVVIVSPMNGIKMCFDRAIIGKGSVGRIPEYDPSISTAIAARAVLYWKLAFSNNTNPGDMNAVNETSNFWDKAGWTFVAYTHDDDDPNDDDLGDDTDDDYSEDDDGGAVHLSYRMSEELPQYASDYGVSANCYNTSYPQVTDMLEDGLGFWCHADHGGYNKHLETGAGVIGLSGKAQNPWRDWDDGANVDDPDGSGNTIGLANPSGNDHISGNDIFYGIHDLPSTLIYLQDCQVGGTHMPANLLRLGSSGVVGDHYSMYIDPSPVYNDRLVKGLFSGMDYGQANRWALDESSAVYSMHDPAPSDGGNNALGYSVQCTLYGDPEIVLARPTLIPHLSINYPIAGTGNITIGIFVTDQYGEPYPSGANVTLNGEYLLPNPGDGGIGVYSYDWSLDNIAHMTSEELMSTDFIVRVLLEEPGYYNSQYNSSIVQEYMLNFPFMRGNITNLEYTGEWIQNLSLAAEVSYDLGNDVVLNDTVGVIGYMEIFDSNGFKMGQSVSLGYVNGSWNADMDITLMTGNYYVNVTFLKPYFPRLTLQSGIFNVKHIMKIESGDVDTHIGFGGGISEIYLSNVSCVHSGLGEIDNLNFRNSTYEIFSTDGNTTNTTGNLIYLDGFWTKDNISVLHLPDGIYHIRINISAQYEWAEYFTASLETEHGIRVSEPTISYRLDPYPSIDITNVSVTTAADNPGIISEENVQTRGYRIVSSDTFEDYANGSYVFNGTHWKAYGIDAGMIPPGVYRVESLFTTTSGKIGSSLSGAFLVGHELKPESFGTVLYEGDFLQKLSIYGVRMRNTYNGSDSDSAFGVSSASFILSNEDDSPVLTGDLSQENDHWSAYNIDVSGIGDGLYSLRAVFDPVEGPEMNMNLDSFELVHGFRIKGAKVYLVSTRASPQLTIENVSIECSYLNFDPQFASVAYYITNTDTSDVSSGMLKPRNGTFSDNIEIEQYYSGSYDVDVEISTTQLSEIHRERVGGFEIIPDIEIESFTIANIDGKLKAGPISVISNIKDKEEIGDGDVSFFNYSLKSLTGNSTVFSGALVWGNDHWMIAEIDVSGLTEGNYYMEVYLSMPGIGEFSRKSNVISIGTSPTDDDDISGDDDDDDIANDDDDGSDNGNEKGADSWTTFLIIGILLLLILLILFFVLAKRKDEEVKEPISEKKDPKEDGKVKSKGPRTSKKSKVLKESESYDDDEEKDDPSSDDFDTYGDDDHDGWSDEGEWDDFEQEDEYDEEEDDWSDDFEGGDDDWNDWADSPNDEYEEDGGWDADPRDDDVNVIDGNEEEDYDNDDDEDDDDDWW